MTDGTVAGEGDVDADGLTSLDCIETGCVVLTGTFGHAILFVYPSQTNPPRLQFVHSGLPSSHFFLPSSAGDATRFRSVGKLPLPPLQLATFDALCLRRSLYHSQFTEIIVIRLPP